MHFTENALRDWFLLVTTGLGVSFAPHIWLGGLFLSLAGASMAFRHDPERDTRERWSVFLTAAGTAHVVGIIVYMWFPDFPPQLAMFGAGVMSRRIIRLLFRIADRVEARSDTIAGKIVERILPGQVALADQPEPAPPQAPSELPEEGETRES